MSIKFPQHIADALIASGLAEAEAPVEVPVPAPAAAAPMPSPSVALNATPADSAFIRPAWYGRLQFGLLAPDQRGASLFGPRGSGKTTAVHHAAQEAGLDLVTFQAAAGNTIDDLIGQRDLDNGRTIFTDGPLAEAIRKDSWLLIEEANMLHPGTLSKLNTLTDGSGDRLKLPSGEALCVGNRFRVILAFNEGSNYAGTREVNAQQANIVREQFALTRRQARVQIVQTTRAVQVAEANLRVSAQNRDLAAESVRLSRIAYTSGAGTSFDLVDTQRRLREAELDLAIKEFEVVRAKVAALLALATCDV